MPVAMASPSPRVGGAPTRATRPASRATPGHPTTQAQLSPTDRYRRPALDNPGAGSTPPPKARSQGRPQPTTRPSCCARSACRRPRRRLLGGQRHRPGVGASSPRSRPQPRPRQHLGAPHAHFRPMINPLALDGRGSKRPLLGRTRSPTRSACRSPSCSPRRPTSPACTSSAPAARRASPVARPISGRARHGDVPDIEPTLPGISLERD
jgi:hypothetical protein